MAAERSAKATKDAKAPKAAKAAKAPKHRREGLPERLVFDATVLLFALEHENPKRKDDPRVADCREVWERSLREARVLLPPFVLLEVLAGGDDDDAVPVPKAAKAAAKGRKPKGSKAADETKKARPAKRVELAFPLVRAVEHVAFTYQVAERMAAWARPQVLASIAKEEGVPRRVVGHDALVVGVADFYRADVVVTLDPATKRLAKLAGVRAAEPRDLLRGTQREMFR